ncbi:MAG TPA: rhamnose ABC transporter substrate-binding protein [Clostridia bacterium]|nr:rhamnose ABC transporter substrate-binding protein [Clostridia bacterium]
MKKLIALVLCLFTVFAMVACAQPAAPATADPAAPAAAPAAGDAAQTYAVITKSAGNPYNEREAAGFEEAIKAAGYTAIIKHPAEITAEAQITLINELVAQGVSGIAVAANDKDALETALKAAMAAGIKVVSLDSSVNPASRLTHINQAGVQQVAQALADAVLDLTKGEGDWAILSATSTASNQNAWIEAQKEIMKGDKYSKLNLVEVAYGDDEYQKSVDQTQALLQNYPNLKVICAPTTVGIAAASKVITDAGLQGKVIVTGLGLPSEMAEFMGAGNVACPYMFLWNPIDVGRVAAYALVEMVNGKLTGELGQSFTAANGTTYTVTEAGDGGTEIIIGPPFAFTAENIAEWKTVY